MILHQNSIIKLSQKIERSVHKMESFKNIKDTILHSQRKINEFHVENMNLKKFTRYQLYNFNEQKTLSS